MDVEVAIVEGESNREASPQAPRSPRNAGFLTPRKGKVLHWDNLTYDVSRGTKEPVKVLQNVWGTIPPGKVGKLSRKIRFP
eukprot:scaffold4614_cov247-Pinguiococcus_pyrenoidosus.AAC.9